jgi:hypothetical protein
MNQLFEARSGSREIEMLFRSSTGGAAEPDTKTWVSSKPRNGCS